MGGFHVPGSKFQVGEHRNPELPDEALAHA